METRTMRSGEPNFEIELAKAVHKLVRIVAASRGLTNDDAAKVGAILIHRLAHRIVHCSIAQLHTHAVMIRIEILAERLVGRTLAQRGESFKRNWLDDEECRKVLKRESPELAFVTPADLLQVWLSLTKEEARVVQLNDLELDDSVISYILGIPPREVIEIKRRADEKIHQAYVSHR